jgi:ATP synthase subunit 6
VEGVASRTISNSTPIPWKTETTMNKRGRRALIKKIKLILMTSIFLLFSPLEQFQVFPIIPLYSGFLDISVTNETLFLFLIFVFCYLTFNGLNKKNDGSFFIVPTEIQLIVNKFYKLILVLVRCNIKGEQRKKFLPIVFFIYMFITLLNVSGLVPYSFTVTTHFIITLTLSLAIYGGTTIISIRTFGFKTPLLFLPEGTNLLLGLLLVPVEFISYIFRPISLAVRLFANMMAGHILMKVIAGFSYTLIGCTGILFVLNYIPLVILLPIYGLETLIAFIQAFVFSLLFCIYLNDSINLH